MLTLNDGRSELWQWDTGRTLSVDADCSQVHFSNNIFGRSVDVDVTDGVAIIPDILLQSDKDLNVWAFVGTAENGYTKIRKTFKVNRRNRPADYVFTPADQTSLEEIKEKIDYLESIQDPDAIKNAVEDYLEQNPVESPVQSVNGKTGAVELTSTDVGAISQDDLQNATNAALEQAKASGEFDGPQGPKGDPGETGPAGVDGQPGADGKSAYQYAQEGGYTGTEAEFAEKLAKEMPDKLPNPNALTFTGAVTGSYDGSAPVNVEIPSGGGGGGSSQWKIIRDLTITENADRVDINTDDAGESFSLHEIHAFSYTKSYGDTAEFFIFLMNGYWGAYDPYFNSGFKSPASSKNYYVENHFIATMQNGIADVFQPWRQNILNSNAGGDRCSIGDKYQAIKSVSFVGKFIAGCRFVLVGRVSS